MAKTKQYEKILEVLKEASPNAVSKEKLNRLFSSEIPMYRISTYIYLIKKHTGIPVKSVRDGRPVLGYYIPVDDVESEEVVRTRLAALNEEISKERN